MTKQFAKKSIASKLIFPAVVAAAFFTTSTQAANITSAQAVNNFEIVRGISDGSPYPFTSDGAAGRRGDVEVKQSDAQSHAWLERQRRITDGVTE
ncbi:MAG: hypothetical protein ACREV9_16540 [Burkholderiales bacterium]